MNKQDLNFLTGKRFLDLLKDQYKNYISTLTKYDIKD